MNITLSNQKLDAIDLSHLAEKYPHESRKHLNEPSGQSEYKLYAYLSKLFHGIVIADLGTRFGNSALALSYSYSNIVESYDVNMSLTEARKKEIDKSNIWFFCEDILESRQILGYQIIMLDVDPHDAKQEERCINFLKANNYKGLVLLDDIGPSWPTLHNYWNSISDIAKYDLTQYGHASGTGLLDFSNELSITFEN